MLDETFMVVINERMGRVMMGLDIKSECKRKDVKVRLSMSDSLEVISAGVYKLFEHSYYISTCFE